MHGEICWVLIQKDHLQLSVESPCIKVCTLEGNICIGCYRTQDEIREWMIFSDKQKKETLDKIKLRKQQNPT